MDDSKLNRLREELKAAKKKRDSWEAKVKDLERRYNEAEKVCVYGIFQAANMTPEQLAELIRLAESGIPHAPAFIQKADTEDDTFEEEDNKE